jgi:hypothetical protein
MGTFAETTVVNYHLLLPTKENQLPFPFAANERKLQFSVSFVFHIATDLCFFQSCSCLSYRFLLPFFTLGEAPNVNSKVVADVPCLPLQELASSAG